MATFDSREPTVDTYLDSSAPAARQDGATWLSIRNNVASTQRRSIVMWDLSSLVGATINSAVLTFNVQGGMTFGRFVDLYMLDTYTPTNAATWLTRDGTNGWDTAGGDFGGATIDELEIDVTNDGDGEDCIFDVLTEVAAIAAGGNNYGWIALFRDNVANSDGKWDPRSDATEADRPRLLIDYDPPATSIAPTTIPLTTVPPTTLAPTSLAPTSLPPTTLAPTTLVPTSLPPTTLAPVATTKGPTTAAPTTIPPTTTSPTSLPPTTLAPTTIAPTTLPPTSLAPTSLAPTSLPPTSLSPTSLPPTSLPPTTLAPTSIVPTSLPPTTIAPTTVGPTTVGPTSLPPTSAAPTTAQPTSLPPTTLPPTTTLTTTAPTTEAPATEEPTPEIIPAVKAATIPYIKGICCVRRIASTLKVGCIRGVCIKPSIYGIFN